MQKENFKWRSFVSFGMFFSFLIMALTGLLLYIAPSGRVYSWTNWHFLGLDLKQWKALHTMFSYLFIGMAIAHVFSLNWKVLFSYFTRKTKQGLRRKRELALSIVIVSLFFVGSTANFQPFKVVMDLGSKASAFWGKAIDYPPVAYIELMPIDRFAIEVLGITPEAYAERIRMSGYQLQSTDVTIAEAAKANRVAPYVFFRETTRGLKVLEIPGR